MTVIKLQYGLGVIILFRINLHQLYNVQNGLWKQRQGGQLAEITIW